MVVALPGTVTQNLLELSREIWNCSTKCVLDVFDDNQTTGDPGEIRGRFLPADGEAEAEGLGFVRELEPRLYIGTRGDGVVECGV